MHACMCAQSCLTLYDPMVYSPVGLSVHGISQARLLEWGYHFLLQGIFLTQGSNQCLLSLLHWRWILYCWVTEEAQRVVLRQLNEVEWEGIITVFFALSPLERICPDDLLRMIIFVYTLNFVASSFYHFWDGQLIIMIFGSIVIVQ